MPVSKFDMASQALVLVGHRPIAAFDGPSAGEIAANQLYQASVDEVLGLHRWRFATKAVQLSRLADAPLTEWSAAYALPAEASIIHAVQIRGKDIEFDRFEDELHCDADVTDTVILIRGRRVAEEAWPPYFEAAVRLKLASVFALPVAEDANKASFYEGKFIRQLALAKTLDSQGRTAAKMPVGRLRRYMRPGP